MHEALVLIHKHIGDFTDFFQDISFDNAIQPQCPQRLRWRESMETPMFVGASGNTTLVLPLWR